MKYGVALMAVLGLMVFGLASMSSPRPMDCAGDCVTGCSDDCPNDSECYNKCLNKCLAGCDAPDVPEPSPPEPVPEPAPGGTADAKAWGWTSAPVALGGDLCCYDGSGKLAGNCPDSLPWYKDTGLCYATSRQCEAEGTGSCHSCGACK